MEKNLEHKIAEAFQKRDASVQYQRRDELWGRLSNAQQLKSGVHPFWKIAAALLAVFFITGAFAAYFSIKNLQKQLDGFEIRNNELNLSIDSLQKVTPLISTEIKYIEKEVQVFVPVEKEIIHDVIEKEQFENLKQENRLLKKQLDLEMKNWQSKIDSLTHELLVLNDIQKQNIKVSNRVNSQTNVVEIKPEKSEPQLQQKLQSPNPKLKIQLFPNPAEKANFDMNTSIFKK